jgi:hypothetical protein
MSGLGVSVVVSLLLALLTSSHAAEGYYSYAVVEVNSLLFATIIRIGLWLIAKTL